VFDYLQFLDGNGNPVLLLDFNQSVAEYLGDGWGEPEYWGGDEGWICTAYGNCSLNINPPRDAHFIRLRAALQPVNPYTEWKELLRNAIRMGVRVNGTITDDGLHVNGTDLTKCISNRFWICHYVLKPDVDSDNDGIPNCIKIAEKHYRALDLNPRIPEPKPIKIKNNIGAFYVNFWGRESNTRTSDWKLGTPFTPLIGFYRSDDPDTPDRHIKQAVEHGIKIFIMWFSDPASHPYGEWQRAFEDGFLRARYIPYIKFAISYNWPPPYENPKYLNRSYSKLIQHTQQCMYYVCKNWFSHPSYLRIDGRPFMMVEDADYCFWPEMGLKKFNSFIETIRDSCRNEGFDVYLVGNVMTTWTGEDRNALEHAKNTILPFDAISARIILNAGEQWEYDKYGNVHLVKPYDTMVKGYVELSKWWAEQAKKYGRAFIPPLCPGFNNSILYKKGIDNWLVVRTDSTPEKFKSMCEGVKSYINPTLNMVICCAWNEFQEGNVIEPTKEFGFTYLDVLREVFS